MSIVGIHNCRYPFAHQVPCVGINADVGGIRHLLNSGPGLAFVILFAPLAEELIFRGVLLNFFIERNKAAIGTVLVSLLFSLLHGLHQESLGWQLYTSSFYFIMSLVLCHLYIARGSLWPPIVFHSAFNGTMAVLFRLLT